MDGRYAAVPEPLVINWGTFIQGSKFFVFNVVHGNADSREQWDDAHLSFGSDGPHNRFSALSRHALNVTCDTGSGFKEDVR